MKRILKPVSYVAAAIYFVADLLFVGVTMPISNWIARHFEMRAFRRWIDSLPPYVCLALFLLPVIVLEPVKYVAAYMLATGRLTGAVTTFIAGELLKLVLIERLFDLTRDKLMTIPAFAWAYDHYLQARTWFVQLEAVRVLRTMSRSAFDHLKAWRVAVDQRLAWTGRSDRGSYLT
jgi:hypothetical protein